MSARKPGSVKKKTRPVENTAFRYCGKPDKEQQFLLNRTLGACRWLHNRMLSDRMTMYEQCGDQEKRSPAWYKHVMPYGTWLKEADSSALANEELHLNRAYENFFAGRAGYPKFRKKSDHHDSYTTSMAPSVFRKLGISFKNQIEESIGVILDINDRYGFNNNPNKWQFISDGTAGAPLCAKIEGAPFESWYFIPVTKDSVTKEDILGILGSKEAEVISSDSKVTFLTANENVYNQMKNIDLNLISLRISVALVNKNDGLIGEETYLKTSAKLMDSDRLFVLTSKGNDTSPLTL